jgi:hypothetical protein
MIEVTCSACSKTLSVADSAAGKTGKCPQCGAAIVVPSDTTKAVPVPLEAKPTEFSPTRSPAWKKSSATERALQAALKAMDAKASVGGRQKSSTRTSYDLGTKSRDQQQPAQPETAKESKRRRPAQPPGSDVNTPLLKRKLGRKEFKLIGAVAGGLALLFILYKVVMPGEFVSANQEHVLKLKDEADRLAGTGKIVQAYEKYQAIYLLTAHEKLNSRLQKVADETNVARARLRGQVEELQARARTARSRSQ